MNKLKFPASRIEGTSGSGQTLYFNSRVEISKMKVSKHCFEATQIRIYFKQYDLLIAIEDKQMEEFHSFIMSASTDEEIYVHCFYALFSVIDKEDFGLVIARVKECSFREGQNDIRKKHNDLMSIE